MPAPSIPPMIASRYRVLRELGRGNMGAVYLVEHIHTGAELALKVLHAHVGASPAIVERFKREARAPARVKSEHVVQITDADVAPELGGAPFLVMERLEGCDLAMALKERGALPPEEVVAILGQVAAALDKAHALGVVHRDLKPENIFLHRPDGGAPIVKIVDFGISKMTGGGRADDGRSGSDGGPEDMAEAGLTQSGAALGTPLYMAPEQARGHASMVGPPADLWALGLIAFKLLSGTTYWTAKTLAALLTEILFDPMVPASIRAPGWPAAFDAWFARSCNRDPAARWSSAGEQVAALAEALGAALPATRGATARAVPGALSSSPSGERSAQGAASTVAGGSQVARSGELLAHTTGPLVSTHQAPIKSGRRGTLLIAVVLASISSVIGAAALVTTRSSRPASAPRIDAAALSANVAEVSSHRQTPSGSAPSIASANASAVSSFEPAPSAPGANATSIKPAGQRPANRPRLAASVSPKSAAPASSAWNPAAP